MSIRLQYDHYVCRVTEQHKRDSLRRIPGTPTSHCCPVALSLNEATQALWAVGRQRAFRRDAEKNAGPRNLIVLPAWMTYRIRHWDATGELDPFQFILAFTRDGEWVMTDPQEGPHR